RMVGVMVYSSPRHSSLMSWNTAAINYSAVKVHSPLDCTVAVKVTASSCGAPNSKSLIKKSPVIEPTPGITKVYSFKQTLLDVSSACNNQSSCVKMPSTDISKNLLAGSSINFLKAPSQSCVMSMLSLPIVSVLVRAQIFAPL